MQRLGLLPQALRRLEHLARNLSGFARRLRYAGDVRRHLGRTDGRLLDIA